MYQKPEQQGNGKRGMGNEAQQLCIPEYSVVFLSTHNYSYESIIIPEYGFTNVRKYPWLFTNILHCLLVFQMTPKPYKKITKLTPEASKWHSKWSLSPRQNTLCAPHVDEPEKNTKTVPKQAPKGTPKCH